MDVALESQKCCGCAQRLLFVEVREMVFGSLALWAQETFGFSVLVHFENFCQY